MLLASGLYALGGKLKNQNKSTMKTSFAVLQRITRQVFKGGQERKEKNKQVHFKESEKNESNVAKKNPATLFCMCVEKDPKISLKSLFQTPWMLFRLMI